MFFPDIEGKSSVYSGENSLVAKAFLRVSDCAYFMSTLYLFLSTSLNYLPLAKRVPTLLFTLVSRWSDGSRILVSQM